MSNLIHKINLKKGKIMIDTQLELGFGNARPKLVPTRPERRLTRAKWWFQRMRNVVDRAFEWEPATAPRPEQIWLQTESR
jgi:hypothetical protein